MCSWSKSTHKHIQRSRHIQRLNPISTNHDLQADMLHFFDPTSQVTTCHKMCALRLPVGVLVHSIWFSRVLLVGRSATHGILLKTPNPNAANAAVPGIDFSHRRRDCSVSSPSWAFGGLRAGGGQGAICEEHRTGDKGSGVGSRVACGKNTDSGGATTRVSRFLGQRDTNACMYNS